MQDRRSLIITKVLVRHLVAISALTLDIPSAHKAKLLIPGDRKSGNGMNLCQERFRLGIRKNFLTARVVRDGTGCPWRWWSLS